MLKEKSISSKMYSQHGEDKYLESLFDVTVPGFCVDVGATDGIGGNNTYLFEKRGWGCICIEPISAYYEQCKQNRKVAIRCAVGEKAEEDKEFTVFTLNGDNYSAISGLKPDERLVESHKHLITNTQTIQVPVRTLTSILDEYYAPTNIDFISIDTENTELDVLKGMDFNKYKVRYLCIENNFNEPMIEEYLLQFNFKKIHRLAVNDFYRNEAL
jgi:FkbM family methyltransferase